VDVFDCDAGSLGLVLDQGLKLSPHPAMELGAHALAGLDPAADVSHVLHHDLAGADTAGLGDDGLVRFVVDVPDTLRLLAGDLPELLSRALAAVGPKAAAQG